MDTILSIKRRGAFWNKALKLAWGRAVLTVSGVFTVVAFIRDEFLPKDQQHQLGEALGWLGWSWKAWFIASLVIAIIGLLEGGYRIGKKMRKEIDELSGQLNFQRSNLLFRYELWELNAQGVNHRNATIDNQMYPTWKQTYERWHNTVLEVAWKLDRELKYRLATINTFVPERMDVVPFVNDEHRNDVNTISEITYRLSNHLQDTSDSRTRLIIHSKSRHDR